MDNTKGKRAKHRIFFFNCIAKCVATCFIVTEQEKQTSDLLLDTTHHQKNRRVALLLGNTKENWTADFHFLTSRRPDKVTWTADGHIGKPEVKNMNFGED